MCDHKCGLEEDESPRQIIPKLCAQFYRLGWCSGTGGGVSVRDGDTIYVAPSGVQKERITSPNLFVLDREGNVLTPPSDASLRPSACTPLFLNAYKLRNAGAVIHSHAPEAALITLLYPGKEFRVSRLEMIKGIEGHGYEDTLVVPIMDNAPFEEQLAGHMEEVIRAYPRSTAALVRRHGLYVWGKTWQSAKSQAECYHYLFNFILESRKLGLESFVMRPSVRCVLLDIEGTTTSISFVKDSLFPLARAHIRQFLLDHSEEEDIRREYLAIRDTLAKESIECPDLATAATHLERWIDEDRKDTSLKYIQGRVWESLYKSGQVKGHLYDDVAPSLTKWRDGGLKVAIYSSGSVQAQHLLFQHSVGGDLTPLIDSYFDTKVGHKQEASSYLAISHSLHLHPSDILFLSDVLGEIQAAASVGFQIGHVIRDALPTFLYSHPAPIYRHFGEIPI